MVYERLFIDNNRTEEISGNNIRYMFIEIQRGGGCTSGQDGDSMAVNITC